MFWTPFLTGSEMIKTYTLKILLLVLAIFIFGFLLPINKRIPVEGATSADWNPHSFWYSPWGRSGTHKGIDIFAQQGRPVITATNGFVIRTGFNEMGGNYVLMLGAKWRLYYYAHLQYINSHALQWHNAGETIGTVGATGNAAGKPPHLHFSIISLFPLLLQYDASKPQAWLKMYYLDPNEWLNHD